MVVSFAGSDEPAAASFSHALSICSSATATCSAHSTMDQVPGVRRHDELLSSTPWNAHRYRLRPSCKRAISISLSPVGETAGALCSVILDSFSVCFHWNPMFGARFLIRTRAAVKVVFELVAELGNKADGRHGCGVAQGAECASKHVFGQVLHVIYILRDSPSGMEPSQRLSQPVSPFATWDAPTAALVLVELHGAQRELDDAGLVVEDHHAAGPEHGAGLHHRIEIHRHIDLAGLR